MITEDPKFVKTKNFFSAKKKKKEFNNNNCN